MGICHTSESKSFSVFLLSLQRLQFGHFVSSAIMEIYNSFIPNSNECILFAVEFESVYSLRWLNPSANFVMLLNLTLSVQ